MLASSLVQGELVSFAWSTNQPNVAGFKIYYSRTSRGYTNNVDVGQVSTFTISNLVPDATYFFAATSYSSNGVESLYSNEVSITIPTTNTITPVTYYEIEITR